MNLHSSTLRVLQILEYLGKNNNATIEHITKHTHIPYTTAYRILQTCLTKKYVELSPEKHYRLTQKFFHIAKAYMQAYAPLISVARAHLQKLFFKTKETVHLAVLSGTKVLYIDKIDSDHSLRMHSRIGNEAPIHCTGVGKALLAWMSEPAQQALIESLQLARHTDNTITQKKALHTHLQTVRTQHYAEDTEEHEPHIHCLAMPVFDEYNHVMASISVSCPTVRFFDDYKDLVLKTLAACAENVSKLLGNKDYAACLRGEVA